MKLRYPAIAAVLVSLLLSFAPRAWSGAGPDRAFVLLRLPGRSGRACLTCHDATATPHTSEALRAHVAEQYGPMPDGDFAQLEQYLGTLRATAAQHTERDDLAESMRSLGYLDYQRSAPLPDVGTGVTLNAFELRGGANGVAELGRDAASPTQQSLRIRGGGTAASGIVLPPYRIEPGTYHVALRTTTPIAAAVPARFLVIAKDAQRRDVPLQRTSDREATATFTIERTTPATFSILVLSDAPLTIGELAIERMP